DVAVAIGGNEMVTELSSVLKLTKPNETAQQSKINRAAFIALDRIMLREPDTLAAIYSADPSFLDYAPSHRASLVSRLDPAVPAQKQALLTYLASVPAGGTELAYFSNLFPAASFFEGNRLVTGWETASTSKSTAERDAIALSFVNSLISDPAYKSISTPLGAIRERLQSFIADAAPQVNPSVKK
ncbi:MAG: hypothetical protein ABW223_03400, partial [Rariglobus sp.]